jgi:hypothetical protein
MGIKISFADDIQHRRIYVIVTPETEQWRSEEGQRLMVD